VSIDEAIKREIRRLEAEVERLQTLLETFNGECVVCDSVSEITKVQAELAKLRKVVEAARRVMDAVMAQPQDVVERNIAAAWLDAALAELDKEGNKRIKCNI